MQWRNTGLFWTFSRKTKWRKTHFLFNFPIFFKADSLGGQWPWVFQSGLRSFPLVTQWGWRPQLLAHQGKGDTKQRPHSQQSETQLEESWDVVSPQFRFSFFLRKRFLKCLNLVQLYNFRMTPTYSSLNARKDSQRRIWLGNGFTQSSLIWGNNS